MCARAFPKLARAYFALFEIVFRNHLPHVLARESHVFLSIVRACHDGISHSDASLSAQCAATIDHLASFHFERGARKREADAPALAALYGHVQAQPDLLTGLITTLFNQLLFGPPSNHWAVTRPVLPLMLADERAFSAYREHLLATQPPDVRQRLSDAFGKLVADVQRNLEPNNRDRFMQKLSAFRVESRAFITV